MKNSTPDCAEKLLYEVLAFGTQLMCPLEAMAAAS